jgi:hypothetical protein
MDQILRNIHHDNAIIRASRLSIYDSECPFWIGTDLPLLCEPDYRYPNSCKKRCSKSVVSEDDMCPDTCPDTCPECMEDMETIFHVYTCFICIEYFGEKFLIKEIGKEIDSYLLRMVVDYGFSEKAWKDFLELKGMNTGTIPDSSGHDISLDLDEELLKIIQMQK